MSNAKANALHGNLDVDYVIVYRFTDAGINEAFQRSPNTNANHIQAKAKPKQSSRSSFRLWPEWD